MTFIQLKKKPKVRMGLREPDEGDIPSHRAFVRRHACIVPGCESREMEAAHCRAGIPNDGRGGTGKKPHDKWTFAACHDHHAEQHRIGEHTFAAKYRIEPIKMAERLWRESPARIRIEQRQAAE